MNYHTTYRRSHSMAQPLRQQTGFTIIELCIVSIIVAVLATLVAMTYSGVQIKNRNAERQDSINAIQQQMEAYYAQTSRYPNINELNDPQWRATNLKRLSASTLRDPQWHKEVVHCSVRGETTFASQPVVYCYSYQSAATDGSSCTSNSVICTQYTLTATLEGGEKYVKSSMN